MLHGFKSPSVTRLPLALNARQASLVAARRAWRKTLTLAALAIGLLAGPALAATRLERRARPAVQRHRASAPTLPQISPDGLRRLPAGRGDRRRLRALECPGRGIGDPVRLSDGPARRASSSTFAISPDSAARRLHRRPGHDRPDRALQRPIDGGVGAPSSTEPWPRTATSSTSRSRRPATGSSTSPTGSRPTCTSSTACRSTAATSVKLNADLHACDYDVDGLSRQPGRRDRGLPTGPDRSGLASCGVSRRTARRTRR